MSNISMGPGLALGNRIWAEGEAVWLHGFCGTHKLGIWTPDGDVIRHAWGVGGGANIYYCPAVFCQGGLRLDEDIYAMPGFCIDIDFGDEGHKEETDFETIEEAYAHLRLAAGPFQPQVLICSGHGLQGLVLFEERVVLGSASDHERMERLVKGFQGIVGSDIGGLSQPYRLPGTINQKPDIPGVATVILDWNLGAPGYRFADMEAFVLANCPVEPKPMPMPAFEETPDLAFDDMGPEAEVAFADLPDDLRAALMTPCTDRSALSWKVLRALYDAGIDEAQAIVLLALNPQLAEKWEGRLPREVERCYKKFRADEYATTRLPPALFD